MDNEEGAAAKKRWDRFQEFFEMGNRALEEGEPEYAILFFDQARSVVDDDPECLYLTGVAYHRLYRYDKAEEFYWKSVLLAPLMAQGWSDLARLKSDLTLHEEAVMLYQKSLEIQPAKPDTWRGLGESYEALGRFDESRECYSFSLELDPDDNISAYCLACVHARLGDVESSVQLLSRLVQDPLFLISARREKLFNDSAYQSEFHDLLWADEHVI